MTQLIPPVGLRGAVDLTSLVQRAAQPREGTDAGTPVTLSVFALDDQSFGEAVELSRTVPVIVVVWTPRSETSVALTESLRQLVSGRDGRMALATVEADTNPQIVRAMQVQAAPTVVAIIAGQPVPLFQGAQPAEILAELLDQVGELAVQHGVTGQLEVAVSETDGAAAEAVAAPRPPLHQEAVDALDRGDFEAAVTSYRTAIAQNPRDTEAVVGLARAALLARLAGSDKEQIRSRAATEPHAISAQLLAADLDISGGHIADGFDRLLTLFPSADTDGKKLLRERLIEYFDLVGPEDPRVLSARRRLTALLF
ncbi:MAG: hypothetical protein B5766_02730 [Candidatus Lumbricidophila eiseniae]|uniref:Thioredoxin domain-containing protein n=1 Tax=Candidatus Lumbricidiphila eiseniae TaxID=1969409 RepID=A0A2A6FTY4_9MICO|nr:MAG: hypothetical protein B5766_02730 [Candidatus Lumbricidophila eiseniae]